MVQFRLEFPGTDCNRRAGQYKKDSVKSDDKMDIVS